MSAQMRAVWAQAARVNVDASMSRHRHAGRDELRRLTDCADCEEEDEEEAAAEQEELLLGCM